MDLPKGTVKKSRDGAVELWFKNSITGSGGPLIGYQDKALGSASTTGVPVLYVGTDGKLRGQFGTGSINPDHHDGHGERRQVAPRRAVVDGRRPRRSTWTVSRPVSSPGKTIDHTLLTFNQIGAAYASTPGSWPAWGTTAQRSYNGLIDEVAIYAGPLGAASVAAHYKAATTQADLLSKVTLPSGRVDAVATYDVGRTASSSTPTTTAVPGRSARPRCTAVTPTCAAASRCSTLATAPACTSSTRSAAGCCGSAMPLGMEARPEDKPGEPVRARHRTPCESAPSPIRTTRRSAP